MRSNNEVAGRARNHCRAPRTYITGGRITAESETSLVLRATAGDRQAFERLVEGCRPWVFGICLRLSADCGTAEDLVQETLLRAFRDLGQLRDPGRFRCWLNRIAVNVCRMHLRRVASRPQECHLQEQDQPLPSADAPPLGVDEALARVAAANRRLILLYYGEGLSHAEVAEVVALSPSAVKSRLHRTRERLRKEMLAMMTEEQKARLGVIEAAPWKLHTILLVEPDGGLRRALRAALTAAGYEVIELPTGEAALAAIAEHRGQMLILDKHCIEPNWIEVLTLVLADAWSRENIPVAVIVDPDKKRDVTLAWQGGAQVCLTRPPKPEELIQFVKRVAQTWPQRD